MKINKKMKLTEENKKLLKKFYFKNKKIHDAILETMIEIDKAFKKIDVQYTATAGTVLGAHLYEDFIPWDDDADLAIKFADYDFVLKELPKALPKHMELLTADTHKNYLYPFPKIINRKYPMSKKEFGERKDFAFLFIDITMFTPTSLTKQPISIRFWGKFMWLRNSDINWLVNILKSPFKLIPSKFAYKKIIKTMKKQNPNGANMLEPFPYTKEIKCWSEFKNPVMLNVRGHQFPMPANYMEFLKENYKAYNIYEVPKKLETHGTQI